MQSPDSITGLLADLDTITEVAQANIISRREMQLEPGETRPAAILYLDVVGFTDLTRVLKPESLGKLIDRTFRIYELTVKGQGGYCDKVVGDAALYVFPGHPNYPPACEAALRAAVALLDRTRQIGESLRNTGLSLAVRIGISFGEVVRQQVGGEGQQLTVMGDTVNLAQRLESSAIPGTIQTTIRVLERAGELTVSEKRGKLDLKGFGEVEVHHVWSFKPSPVRLRGSFRRLTPLIGRTEVLSEAEGVLLRWLETTYPASSYDITATDAPISGRNRVMIFSGAAAVGKSRLAYELLELLRMRMQINTATGHCTTHGSPSNLAGELAQVAGLTPDNIRQRWAELWTQASQVVTPTYAQRQRAHLPFLAYVLDAAQVDTTSIRQADASSFLVEEKLALRAVCELTGFASGAPVVLVIEDLQWMGELHDIVRDLVENTCLPQPMIVLATARDEFKPVPGMFGEGEMREFHLDPLDIGQGKALLDALLPSLSLPERIERELHLKAIGLPYYYEEFARLLMRRGLVAERDGHYELVAGIDDLALPEDIRMLILGRLDQLEPELRALTGRASVLGRSFLKSLLAKLEERLGIISADKLDKELEGLTVQQVLGQEPGDRYFFEHVLTHEAAYGALLKSNRSVLHGIAADMLTEMLVPGTAAEWEILPDLVRHLEEVGDFARSHERCCQLLMLMAHTGMYEQWMHWEERARAAWAELRRACPPLPQVSASLLTVQGWQHYCHGRMMDAEENYEQALSIAMASGDRRREGNTYNFLGTLHRNQGRVDQAQVRYERALRILREVGDRLGEGTVLRNLGILHQKQGRLELARLSYEESLAIKCEVGDRRGEGITLNNLGSLHKDQGQLDKARQCYEESLAIKRETSDRRGEAITLSNMGVLHAEKGRVNEALHCYEQSLSISREIGDKRREGITLNCLGVLHHSQGRMDEARACYEQSLAIRRGISDRDGEGSTLAAFAVWLSDQGELDEAEVMQLAALDIGRGLGLRGLEGQVLTELADVYRKQGRLGEARESLDTAMDVLIGLNDNYYLTIAHCYRVHLLLALDDSAGAAEALAAATELAARIGGGPRSELGRYVATASRSLEQAGLAARA